MLINELLIKKISCRLGDIPKKILRAVINAYLKDITILTFDCLEKDVFPDELKLTDISAIFKKITKARHVSILSYV